MESLTLLREQHEQGRFERQQGDDSRTAVSRSDSEALAAQLRRTIRGEVRFDAGSRALYATDGSNYRQAPIGVVIPRDVRTSSDDGAVPRHLALRSCRAAAAPAWPASAATSPWSWTSPSTMHHVLHIDAGRKLGTVQPGCVLDDLRNAAKKHGLTFGPDPATHSHCTLGGMLGNDSCGSHSLLAAKHGHGLAHRRQHPRARNPDLRRPAAARGRDPARRTGDASSAQGGRAASSTPS